MDRSTKTTRPPMCAYNWGVDLFGNPVDCGFVAEFQVLGQPEIVGCAQHIGSILRTSHTGSPVWTVVAYGRQLSLLDDDVPTGGARIDAGVEVRTMPDWERPSKPCTCIQHHQQTHLEPAGVEQDPECEEHGDRTHMRAEIRRLRADLAEALDIAHALGYREGVRNEGHTTALATDPPMSTPEHQLHEG